LIGVLLLLLISCAGEKNLVILETTDLHGTVLPYDYIENRDLNSSLDNAASFIKKVRSEYDVILLDNGDNLQGQPEVYYYNFIDTVSPHIMAEALNYLDYDAGTVGNHDIEAGHPVYDRLVKEYEFPLLAANAIDISTGEPYFKPYTVIKRQGLKIAVFGLITPYIPNWLPPELYSGIRFDDMVRTAKMWMPILKEEKPDLVIGLFHSGWDRNEKEATVSEENESAAVAYNVPGFDIILTGHDHRTANEKFVNVEGDTVLILNGGSYGRNIAMAEVTTGSRRNGSRVKKLKGTIIDVDKFKPDPDFTSKFESYDKQVRNYVSKVIGTSTAKMSSRDSYFGSSAFVDMIHSVQLEITGADVSFAAPLSFDVAIPEGKITVSDMFKLYKYENMLYTMKLTGEEIKKFLEYSYAAWYNTMTGPGDHLLKLRTDDKGNPVITEGKAWLRNLPYNFDSAAGIDYTVDVSKPEGQRISISGFSDGKPFIPDQTYKVAINSYRGTGGGGHLTKGAGLSNEDLRLRLESSTGKDLRFYIMQYIENKGTISPEPLNNWKVIPEKWVGPAAARDYRLLFGEDSK
jgi:2',3'-cyclic-nucleotide 2'-phosphodiesterase/3'-nucleotidase